jgi:hypothetical protein
VILGEGTTTRERFRVSYPALLLLSFASWALIWWGLYHQFRTGGWRPIHGQVTALTLLGAVFVAISSGVIGPIIVFGYSVRLSVDGTNMVVRKCFGCSTRSFDRSEIRGAKVVQKGIEKAIELVLTDGTRLQFSQFGTGYSRLRTYLGLDGSE